MKKILSLIMAVSVALSVFCCIPAQANLYDGYPYMSIDFEKSDAVSTLQKANILGNSLSPKWKEGGAEGSVGCINLTDNRNWANENFNLKMPLKIGRTYRLSMWVRVNLDSFENKDASIGVIIYTRNAADTNSAYKTVNLNGIIVPNQWSYMSNEFVWDGLATDGVTGEANKPIKPDAQNRLGPRLTSGNQTLYMQLKSLDKYKNDANFAISYDIDDLILEPTPVMTEEEEYDESYKLSADFEDNSNHGLDGIQSIVADAERGGKVGYNITPRGTFFTITARNNFTTNRLYKISAWLKRADDLCLYGGKTTQVDLISTVGERTDFTNMAPDLKYPTMSASNRITEQNKWTYFEWYVKFEAKTYDAYSPTFGLRVGNLKASQDLAGKPQIGAEGVEIYIDDFMIQDMGVVTNADFETGIKTVSRVHATGLSTTEDKVFGWKEEGATIVQSDDVRANADTETTKSMKVSITTDGGKVYQGIQPTNGTEYSISFWAKGEGLEDGQTKPMNLVLDRAVSTVYEKDVYEVPAKETLSDDWLLTNEWQQFTCTYDMDFAVEEGKTAEKNVVPRMPLMYIEVDGNQAGTSFLVDDFTMVDANHIEDDRYPYPYIEYATVDAPNGLVNNGTLFFEYGFFSELDRLEGQSIIRIMGSKDGERWSIRDHIMADYGFAEYAIPESTVNEYLKAEILPVDTTENGTYEVGDMYTLDIGYISKVFDVQIEFTKWDVESGETAARVDVANNDVSLGNIDLVAILAVYDENNTLLTMSNKPEQIGLGVPKVIPISASLAAKEDGDATLLPAYAKLYVWSGTSIADAGEIIYAETVEYRPPVAE